MAPRSLNESRRPSDARGDRFNDAEWSISRAIDGSAVGKNSAAICIHIARAGVALGVTRKRVGSCAQFTSNKRGLRDLPRTRSGETSSLGLEYARPRPRWARLGFPSTTLHSCPDPLSSSTPSRPATLAISSRRREKVAVRPLVEKVDENSWIIRLRQIMELQTKGNIRVSIS